ncbi:cyclin-dependent kinase inhibitor 1C [Protopterus annectens]|uniref:cyclin-dependent kinase inhibitor 1C n=1 Tax=Protopterus annectens TaxID=7888 RepID=UPI001CF96FF2|nr:cyclin-dependent kinase inhibitor 1C [Protopterus annectens]
MSEVQLKAALDRSIARKTFPLERRTAACRCLFGEVDHDELNQDLLKMRELNDRISQERWGFNFELEAPLPHSQLQWEAVDEALVPQFYRAVVQIGKYRIPWQSGSKCTAPEQHASTESQRRELSGELQEKGQNLVGTEVTLKELCTPCKRTTDTSETESAVKRKQPNTDSKMSSETECSSGFAIPSEKTPRKKIRLSCTTVD